MNDQESLPRINNVVKFFSS